jgi:hypothetical protein
VLVANVPALQSNRINQGDPQVSNQQFYTIKPLEWVDVSATEPKYSHMATTVFGRLWIHKDTSVVSEQEQKARLEERYREQVAGTLLLPYQGTKETNQ